MRCISPEGVPELVGALGFAVSQNDQCYRTTLTLDSKVFGAQMRVGASPPDDVWGLRAFIGAVNRWLPSGTGRLLWIDHFETAIAGDDAFLRSVRRGFDEHRSLVEAPGHYFGPQPWHEEDQELVSTDHAGALSVLVGIAMALLLNGSDGWLVAEGATDRVELWEGNIFFYSTDVSRLDAARTLLSGCSPPR